MKKSKDLSTLDFILGTIWGREDEKNWEGEEAKEGTQNGG